jgi:hypothetical protein
MVPLQEVGWRIPAQQDYGMFFFATGDDGKAAFTDLCYPYISVPRGLQGRGETPLERVVSVLSDMLTLPTNNRVHRLIALRYLEDSKSKAANAAPRTALNMPRDADLQIRTAKGLLLQGDPFPVQAIKEMFLTGPGDSVDDTQQEVLGNVMAYYLKDPEAIPALEELLDARSVSSAGGLLVLYDARERLRPSTA